MNKLILILSIILITINNAFAINPELVIGEERVEPGIVFIFEGAIKDHVMPMSMHLAENETHVHIEARVNWDSKNVPKGTPKMGFVPYLYINAKVINEKKRGVSLARNEGIKNCKNEWIAFLDSDDEWMEKKIEKRFFLIKKSKSCCPCFF